MAPDRGNPQPPEAPPAPTGGPSGLIGGRKALPFSDPPEFVPAGLDGLALRDSLTREEQLDGYESGGSSSVQ
jgi:hypothetical protein